MRGVAVLTAFLAAAANARRVQNEIISAFNPASHRTGSRSLAARLSRRHASRPPARSGPIEMRKALILDQDVKGKRILIRTDFSCLRAKDEPSIFTNCIRVDGIIETIRDCLERGAQSVVVMTHMTPPNGPPDAKLDSLGPIAYIMEELLNTPVKWLKSWSGKEVNMLCQKPEKGTLILLNNLHGNLEEEMTGFDINGRPVTADPNRVRMFRNLLSKCADIYVNDAFGVAHTAQSSMLGEGYDLKCAGPELAKDVEGFDKVLQGAEAPVMAIVGGTRIPDKLEFIRSMLFKVDKMMFVGAMAHSFLHVREGIAIGDPVCWETQLEFGKQWREENLQLVPQILDLAHQNGVEIILPLDFQLSSNFSVWGEQRYDVTKEEGIPPGFMALDIGPRSIEQMKAKVAESQTIIWNGPVSDVYFWEKFKEGTRSLTHTLIEATQRGAITCVLGPDTYTASRRFGAKDKLTHISMTKGEALNALWDGRPLPGVSSLSDA